MALCSPLVLNRICKVILLIITLFLFSKPANSQVINCTITEDRYTTNGTFHQSLKIVLRNLTFVANTTKSGFYNFSFGDQKDAVFGLYLCRGDLTQEDCSSCVEAIGSRIIDNCPNSKEVIQWNMECILRYANRNIFSKEEEQPSEFRTIYFSPAPSPNRPPPPPPPLHPFNVSNVIFNLVNETAFGDYSSPSSTRFFATRKDNITGGLIDQAFYSLAQCTPDISPPLCHKCLKQAMKDMFCCGSTARTQVYLPSCIIEYDTQKFFGDTNQTRRPLLNSHPPPSPPPESDPQEPEKPRRSSNIAIIVAVPSAVLALLLLFSSCFFWKKSNAKPASVDDIITMESLQYDINTIKTATTNFSTGNLLGRGGYGSVYKGRLENGQEIAVKKLPPNLGQSIEEFKTQALLIARLQHRNLVRLLGFCVTKEEKFLVNEFSPNSSLDQFLLDPVRHISLGWETRYKIIEGIAKGLLYLHEHSQCKIVHQDLTPRNILLDKDMTPKISNFGTPKLLEEEQVQGISNQIVGTLYMSPEYMRSGELSMKSNVFSFGVIVLEIVSGERSKNRFIHAPEQEEGLIQRAWRLWNTKVPLEFVDPTMSGNFSAEEVTRCIHIGLSCVQEDAEKRPTIATVVSLLNSHSSNLPELAPGEGYYKSDNSTTSLGLHDQSTHTYSGMQDITVLSAR